MKFAVAVQVLFVLVSVTMGQLSEPQIFPGAIGVVVSVVRVIVHGLVDGLLYDWVFVPKNALMFPCAWPGLLVSWPSI